MSTDRVLPISIRRLLEVADTKGATLDRKLRSDIDRAVTLLASTSAETFRDEPSVGEATYAALASDRDPLTDPYVQRALNVHQLIALQGGFEEAARQGLFDIVQGNLELIYEAFKPVYAAAGQKLADAHKIMIAASIDDLDDPRIATSGMKVSRANVDAREALDLLQQINSVFDMLSTSVGSANRSGIGRVVSRYDIGDNTASHATRTMQNRPNLHPWDALTAGYTITLATPQEAGDRAAKAYAADDAYAAQQTEQANEALRRTTSGYFGTPKENSAA